MKNVLKELTKIEKANLKKTRKSFSEEIDFYTFCLNVVNEVVAEIAAQFRAKKIQENVTRDWAVLTICNKVMGTSKVYLDLVSKGYYFDSQILLRCLYENVWLIDWLFKDKRNVSDWISDDEKLKHPWFIRKELKLPEFNNHYYHFLSAYVHSQSSPLSNFGMWDLYDKKGNHQGFEESNFKKIEGFNKNEVNLNPAICVYMLNVLDEHYQKIIRSETEEKIVKIREQMRINSEDALAEFQKLF